MARRPVLLCLVDGLRPDALELVDTPVIHRLMAAGKYSLHAQTVLPSLTLPCIASLFFGVPPEQHGTFTNWFVPGWDEAGLIDLFKMEDLSAASFYNWEQLRNVSRPGSLQTAVCLNVAESHDLPLGEGDRLLTDLVLKTLNTFPDFCFVYLGCLDTAGHRHGWLSRQYLQTLENADACLGRLIQAFPQDGMALVVSDHGGHDFGHGSDLAEDMTIPLIAAGAGIEPGELVSPVSILDIAPTIAGFAGLPIPSAWAGARLPLFANHSSG